MNSDKKYCPHCGKQNLSIAKYCSGCGFEIPDDKLPYQNSNYKIQPNTKQTPQQIIKVELPKVKKKKNYTGLIILIAIATLFIYTNPSENMHLDYVKNLIHQNFYNNPSLSGAFGRIFEVYIGDERTNNILKDVVKRKNYIIFSLTEIQYNGQSQIIAIGILGNFIEMEKLKEFFYRFSS